MTDAATVSIETALRELSALKDKYVWLSSIEIDFVLRFEIGDPSLRVEEKLLKAVDSTDPAARRRIVRPIGQWSLFVGTGLWQIRHFDKEVHRLNATYADSSTSVRRQLSQLDGQKITDFRRHGDSPEWIFDFDLGASVSIKADAGETEQLFSEQWTIFSRRGGSLSCLRDDTMLLEGEF